MCVCSVTRLSEVILVFCVNMVLFEAATPKSGKDTVFRSVPTTVKTSENDTVLLPCYVDNLDSFTVRWWWGNQLVADSGDPDVQSPTRMYMWPNHTLQVSDLRPEDTGEYRCQVVRPAPWGPVEQVHAIEVLYPPSVSPIPADGTLEVRLGEEVDMGCQAAGVPQPIVTWSSHGRDILLLDNRPRLRFLADSRQLSGLYQCHAINGVGEPAIATIHLRIQHPPEVTVERPWVHASPGVRTELQCVVVADPEAMVVWLFRDRPVVLSARVKQRQENYKHSLLFHNVRTDDLGYYLCRASNPLGEAEQVIELSGVANPAVFKNDGHQPLSETNYTLIWEVDSYAAIIEYNLMFRRYPPRGSANWTRIVVPADTYFAGPLHSQAYTLTGLRPATAYEAVVVSRNRFGWSKPSDVLRFATDGSDLEDNELQNETETITINTNVIPAQVAAILREASPTSSSTAVVASLVLSITLVVSLYA